MQQKKFSRRLNYDVISKLFDDDAVKAKKDSYSDSEDGRSIGRRDGFFLSDVESTDADAVEEEGNALPSNHPSVRKRSRLEEKDRARKAKARATSSAGEESGTERATSRGAATDAETDTEASNWKAGLSIPYGNQGEEDYGDRFEDGEGIFD